MKLLLDENLSHRLLAELRQEFPGSSHVRLLGLARADDKTIWDYAGQFDYSIVTCDADFFEMSLLRGHPPKVIWLKSANSSTEALRSVLRSHGKSIREFLRDDTASWIEIHANP